MMGVCEILYALKIICGTLGNQKGCNRRKEPAKVSCPQTLPLWALSLAFSMTLSPSDPRPICLATYLLLQPSSL